jgi:hypothetical protein
MSLSYQLNQIPEEEKNLGPHDRLIHVYHFMKDPNQNQVVNFCYFAFLITSLYLVALEGMCKCGHAVSVDITVLTNSRFRISEIHFYWSSGKVRLLQK